MTSLCDARDYYKRMLELQGKLRKSEEERIRLEERFNLLVQESRNRHDTCISRLRMRYIEFLEEQQIRDERNHKLLGTLDRVDNSLSLIAAKTEKLNVLRKQYETYLLKTYANRQNPGSITGDSGIVSQVDEGYFKKKSPVVQFSHRENQNISLSMIPYRTKDNSWKGEQRLYMQNLPRTRFTPLPTTLYNKINISRTGSVSESKSNPLKIIQNVNQRSQIPQIPSSQIHQPGQDIYNNELMSLANLQVNRNLQAQYLPTPSLENTALNGSLLSHYNKLSTSHVEPIQKTTCLTTSGVLTTENTSRCKSSSMAQSHFTPTFPQHQFNVSMTQNTLYHNADMPQNFQRSNFEDLASASTLGSVPIKIVKADSPRIPVEMFPRTQRQIDYSTSYKPYEHSFNSSKPKEIPTHFLPRENPLNTLKNKNTLYCNVPNLGSLSIPRKKSELNAECRTTRLLENELDRYIDKIRNLHQELDVQSLEDHDCEQNTSGDLLNITLSDDGTDNLPDKAKDECMPQDVAKVLALADNLACKKPSINETSLSRNDRDNDKNAEDRNTKSDTRYDVLSNEIGETSTRLKKKSVNNNLVSVNLELEQLDKNNSNLEKQKRDIAEVKNTQYSNESKKTDLPKSADTRNGSNESVIQDPNNYTQKDYVTHKGEELEFSQEFFDVELLNPWDINRMAKEVLEVQSSESGENIAQPDEHNVIAITTEDEHEKQIQENPVVSENKSEHVIINRIDTTKQQDTLKDSEISLNSEDFNQQNQEEETIQDNHPNDDNFEYTDQHYENEIENATRVEQILEPTIVDEDNQISDVKNTSDEFLVDEQRSQEFGENNVYTSDMNTEFVDPNQQYDYSQIALENNEEYQNYANNDYVITDKTSANIQDEYFQNNPEQYPIDSTQEYVDGNQEYYDDKDESNVYDENYQGDQIHDNDANSEYLQEEYNTTEVDQATTNIETDQNIDNIKADDVGDGFAINEIEEESTNSNNETSNHEQESVPVEQTNQSKKKKDVINSLLDSDTESTIERNVTNTESDFDFQ